MWKQVNTREVPYRGKRISVSETLVNNGATDLVMEVAHVRSAVAVLPVIREDDKVFYIFVKQHRWAIDPAGVDGPIIEACAGKIEDNQSPMAAAIAELKQETGYKAGQWTNLGTFFSSPGITDERIYSFIAEDLIPGEQELEVSERGLEVVRIEQADAIYMVQKNIIKDQKTCNIILQHACHRLKWGGAMRDAAEPVEG